MNYKVQPGDTLDTISKKMGVPATAISGYKSQDPNLIMPGEELTINQSATPVAPTSPTAPAAPTGAASLLSGGQPPETNRIQQAIQRLQQMIQPAQQAPVAPVPQAPVQAPTQAPAQPQAVAQPQVPTQAPVEAPVAPEAPVTQQPEVGKVMRTFTMSDGQQVQMEVTPEVDELLGGEATRNQAIGSKQATGQVSDFFTQYGVSSDKLSTAFTQNPVQTLSALTTQVMKSMQIPDAISNISNITKQIEDLSNERDDEIQKVQDDPWKSAGSKSEEINRIQNKYENRIANRTNTLTLLQNAYQEARQQAEFAVTTAVGLYDKQRAFDQNAIKNAIQREESQAKFAFEREKFDENRRQFGLEYATKQRELAQKEIDSGVSTTGRPVKVSTKEITDLNDSLIASKSLTSMVNKFIENIDKYGTQTIYGKAAGERKSIRTNLLLAMKNLEKTGALDKGTIDVLEGTIPTSKFFATEEAQKASLTELKNVVSSKLEEYINSYRGTSAETDPRTKRAFEEISFNPQKFYE